jgi:polyisoprenoid-binding protein YceI
MLRKPILATAVTLLALGTLPALAQTSTWSMDTNHSQVDFTISHDAVTNVHGAFTLKSGTVVLNDADITQSSVTAVIDITSVNTNNTQRDTHLKTPDFFDAVNNPTMTFKSTKISKVNGQLQLTGDLTLHGVTKSVTLAVDGPSTPQTLKNGKTVSGFSASGTLNRSDFGISKFIPIVGDEVKFTIDVEIVKQ